ncbi:MAG: DNA polymerase III subunit alpha, partial [Evtepia sp.]
AALLTSVLDSQDKVAEYISECKSSGISILPPDVNESGIGFTVSEHHLRFGLSALKGVGRSFTETLLTERPAHGPFLSFPDFCARLLDHELNKRVLDSLIRSGAFDGMHYRRSQLLDAYEQLLDSMARTRRKNLEGQFDLFGMSDASGNTPVPDQLILKDLPEFSAREKMVMEKEITGLYLSGHPMDEYRPIAKQRDARPIGAVMADFAKENGPTTYRDEQKITLAGVITAVKTKTTKNDSLMAYVTLEDDTGTIELLVFSRVLSESGSYLQANIPILVNGRLSVRDDKAPQLLCDAVFPLQHIQPIPEANEPLTHSGRLYLRLPSETTPIFEKIKKIFMMFPGTQKAVFYFTDTGRRRGTTCILHTALLAELVALLGEENVVVKP